MTLIRIVSGIFLGLGLAFPAWSRVTEVEVLARRVLAVPAATLPIPYERMHLRVFFELDPALTSNHAIADMRLAVADKLALRFTAEVVVLQPQQAEQASALAILEPVNRGAGQLLPVLSRGRGAALSASDVDLLGDGFLLRYGDTVVMAGWQDFNSAPVADGSLSLQAPALPVSGTSRESITPETVVPHWDLREGYCARDTDPLNGLLAERTRADGPLQAISPSAWRYARVNGEQTIPDPCYIALDRGFQPDRVYELIYPATAAKLTGVGLAVLRDLASHLKRDGLAGSPIRPVRQVLGYGYSQSARVLRQLVEDGFNADEKGRPAFDGLFIAAAGGGGASINHRYARPSVAGNSVLNFHHPVDRFPFADAGQIDPLTGRRAQGKLDRAASAGVVPKIMHVLTSTEYWARGGSLLHAEVDGSRDLAIPAGSRVYFIAGTQHTRPVLPLTTEIRGRRYHYPANAGSPRYVHRALLRAMVEWLQADREPPASRYPRIAEDTLIAAEQLRWPSLPGVARPTPPPGIWRLDFGPRFESSGIVDFQPPRIGAPYTLLVPAVDEDGNERGGITPVHVAVPLATYAGWNREYPSRQHLGYLSGLTGSTWKFPLDPTPADPRRAIRERYPNEMTYRTAIDRAIKTMQQQRWLLAEDQAAVREEAALLWRELTSSAN